VCVEPLALTKTSALDVASSHPERAVPSRPRHTPRVNLVFSYSLPFLPPLPLLPRIAVITFDPGRSLAYTTARSLNQGQQQRSTPASKFNSACKTTRTQNVQCPVSQWCVSEINLTMMDIAVKPTNLFPQQACSSINRRHYTSCIYRLKRYQRERHEQ